MWIRASAGVTGKVMTGEMTEAVNLLWEKSGEHAVFMFADMKNAVELHNICNLWRELDRLDLKFLYFFLFLTEIYKASGEWAWRSLPLRQD